MSTKFRFHLSLILILPLICYAQIAGDTFQSARAKKSGKVILLYNGVTGFVNKSSDGEVTGILVDIMTEFEDFVERETGISLTHEFVYTEGGDFSLFMEEVKNGSGGVFGLSNVTINEERSKVYAFSPPYIDNVSLVVSNKSATTLDNIENISETFKGMKALSVSGSTYDKRILEIKRDHFPDLEVEYRGSGEVVMAEIAAGSNSFGVLDLNYYLEALQKKLSIRRHASCDVKDQPFGIIMPKSNDWEPLLRKFFNSGFIGSSKHSEIISKNLGSTALRLLENVKNQ